MKVIVDKEWMDKITQLTDACLKAYGNKIYSLVTEVLWKIELIPETKKEEPKKYTVEKQINPKDIK